MSTKRSRQAGRESPDPTGEATPALESRAPVIVGIGASAGGLEAFSRLLQALPVDTGMAFVLVQHLDPQHFSLLGQLLAGRTAMPVHEASDGAEVIADNVYVAPPAQDLVLEQGRLRLRPRDPAAQPHLPIDGLLRSLAEDSGERALGVVLSGAASDGTRGLAAIKAAGGVTFAQDPSSTQYPGMPMSAIDARVVDFVLPPEEIARELARLGGETPFGASPAQRLPEGDGEAAALAEVFALLRDAFRVDFSAYKLPTIRRRVARRMVVRRSADLSAYVALLRDDPAEVDALYRDILIMVTEFFREPETFALLRERVLPEIVRARGDGSELRFWVPGCASGEEVYSLAITLLEVMDAQGVELPVKVFATDISEPDLASARRGLYPPAVTAPIAPELLRKYFSRSDGGHRISKSVRGLCVFARHDVTSDPPFPNLDLVSCRNLLIYLGSGLQRWVIPSLHYALRSDGYLVLGRSESIAGFSELFEVVDAKHKVFRKVSSPTAAALFRLRAAPREQAPFSAALPRAERLPPAAPALVATQDADQAVLAGFAPVGVTIDAQRTIVEFRGDTGPYLKIQAGRATLNLLDLVRSELRGKVRAVVAEAERTGARTVFRSVALGRGKARRTIDLHAIPFATKAGEAHFVVLFDETSKTIGEARKPSSQSVRTVRRSEADELRDELNETRERLEAVIQDQEAANEELRAANEELLSGGEEMQSVNEELETTQEELQSTNQELRARNLELGQIGDDLSNLLTSVSFPIVMVGPDLRIRRFTPAAERLFKVIPGDVGRLVTDLRLRIDLPDLAQVLRQVIETTALTERDIQDDDGRWYAMQARPYKTTDGRVDGAVVTLFDIDEMKRLLMSRSDLANTLQDHYLHALQEIPGLKLAVATETAHDRERVGGDFHDVIPLPDGKVVALVGDVAGKGIEAAGLADTVRIAARATALISPSPDDILRNVGRLVADLADDFVTMVVVTLDTVSGEATVASAGHPPPLYLSGARCELLEPRFGLPLASLDSDYPPLRFPMSRGEALVLYTDGLTEARRNGELFGDERLLELFRGDAQRDPETLVRRARDAALEFAGELTDDLQILALRRT